MSTSDPRCLQLERAPYIDGTAAVAQDVLQLRRTGDADELNVAILDNFKFISEVFPEFNVLCALPAAYDVVPPFDARYIVLVNWGRLLL